MVDRVISSREIDADYVGEFPCFKDILNAVQELSGQKPACSGTSSIVGDRRFSIRRSMGSFLVSEGQQHVTVARVSVNAHALRPAAFSFCWCLNEFCSSMVVKSSSKSWFSWPHHLILLSLCLVPCHLG